MPTVAEGTYEISRLVSEAGGHGGYGVWSTVDNYWVEFPQVQHDSSLVDTSLEDAKILLALLEVGMPRDLALDIRDGVGQPSFRLLENWADERLNPPQEAMETRREEPQRVEGPTLLDRILGE